jgi:hypothetical protein
MADRKMKRSHSQRSPNAECHQPEGGTWRGQALAETCFPQTLVAPVSFLLRFADMRNRFFWLVLLLALPARGAERTFDFGGFPLNQTPPGFRSTVAGTGKPGEWKVILDDAAPAIAPLTPQAPAVSKRSVLAQVSGEPVDEHFPMLVYEEETFGDFTLTTRFKTVGGKTEQMAGMAFRVQDEKNFYVVRASSTANTFRFYKVVDGHRGPLIGPQIEIPGGVWHELTIECKGNRIRCLLNGQEAIPEMADTSFNKGKIAFWTKSDSVSYFADTTIQYTPRENPAQALVRDALRKYPRLIGLRIYMMAPDGHEPRVIASNDEKEIGQRGGGTERGVISEGQMYHARGKDTVAVTLPLRDHNGDPVAAVRVTMKSFPGQTEQNALVRAQPVVREMQKRIRTAEDLVE